MELLAASRRCSVLSTQYLVLRTKLLRTKLLRTKLLRTKALISFVVLGFLLVPTTPALAEEPNRTPAAGHYDLPTMLFVFMLASFIGLGVITRVSRLLHTPLMSLTNAISAIAIVGAITVTGVAHGGAHNDPAAPAGFSIINFLGAIALFASTVNIVSGFLITDRMLKMFKKK